MNKTFTLTLGAFILVIGATILTVDNLNENLTVSPFSQTASISGTGSGLVAHWTFDGKDMYQNVRDVTGNGYNGTITGQSSTTTAPGKIGQAIRLDGVNDYVLTTYTGALTDFTACAWFKKEGNYVATQRILDKNYATGFWLGANSTAANSWGGGVIEPSSPYGRFVTLNDGEWHHICSRRSGTTHTMIGDGGAVVTSGTVPATAMDSTALKIGIDANLITSPFQGNIDDVRIYSRALSLAEILEIYNWDGNDTTVPASPPNTSTPTPTIPLQTGYTGNEIPSERIMDWSEAGVPGGIPTRNTICKYITKSPSGASSITGSINAGTNKLTVSSGDRFEVGHGIKVPGASFKKWTTTPGADLYTSVIGKDGNVLTLNGSADVTVNNVSVTFDDASAIQDAINNCPAGQVVYIPAGTYNLSYTIGSATKSDVVLRGAGPDKTILESGNHNAVSFGGADWPPPQPTIPIASGATKGSNSITVNSSYSSQLQPIRVGSFIKIGAGTNPSYVKNIGVSQYDTQLSVTVRVTSVSGNTINFTPKIPFDFSQYTPKLGVYTIMPTSGVGIEDLTIDLKSVGGPGVSMQQMWGSWIKNVEIKNSAGKVLTLYSVTQSDIRHNYLHDSARSGPNTEGLDLYRDNGWNLIEDNIVYGAGGIVIGDWEGGNVGNVIAYNLVYGSKTNSSNVASADIWLNHGSNNILNLIEGNISGGVIADQYYGSASHDTLLRNWFTATHPTSKINRVAVRLKHFTTHFTLLGNILGTSDFPIAGTISGDRAYGGHYVAPNISGYDGGYMTDAQIIYELGFPNIGNTGFTGILSASNPVDYSSEGSTLGTAQKLDLNVDNTLIRHGNYDYFSRSIIWHPTISSRTIPQSYFRNSKPAYFGSLTWPPFDPASPPGSFNNTNIARIPAGYRYINGVDPVISVVVPPPAPPSNPSNPGTGTPSGGSSSGGGTPSGGTPATSGGGTPTGGASQTPACTPRTISITKALIPTKLLTLRYGMTSADVKTLQVFLNDQGFTVSTTGPGSKGQETSYFGPATQSAINKYNSAPATSVVTVPCTNTTVPATTSLTGVITPATGTNRLPSTYRFTTTLKPLTSSINVKNLQIFLNDQGFTVSKSGSGSKGNETNYFGPATKSALIRFQEYYKTDILSPYNLNKGTGYFGVSTMKKVNALLGR